MDQRHKAMQDDVNAILPKVAEFHDSLTAEQKQKAVKELEEFHERWGG